MKIIVGDPGHGGSDWGAVGNGLKEKDLTLDICKRMASKLEAKYEVDMKLTRTSDKSTSLQARTDFANRLKAAAFLSIHINAGGGTGFESFVMEGALPASAGFLQKNVHKHLSPVLKKYGLKDRGMKKDSQARVKRLHVLRATKMKACLVEIAFIDTKKDAELLKSTAFRDAVAEALADALAETERLKKKATTPKPAPAPVPKPEPQGDEWHILQVGAYRDRDKAEKRKRELEKQGLDVYLFTRRDK